MTRRVFIQIYADAVAKGRRRNFPDMRTRSEIASARFYDERQALKMWTKNRSLFAGRDIAELKAEFEGRGKLLAHKEAE